MDLQQLENNFNTVLSDLRNSIREIQFIIYNYPEVADRYQQLYDIVADIQNFDLSGKADVVIEKIVEYNNLISSLSESLNRNLNLFTIVNSKQLSHIDSDKYDITLLDYKFDETNIPIILDDTKKVIRILPSNLSDNVYYLRIRQNLYNTITLSGYNFSFYNLENINNNASKLIVSIDNEFDLSEIVNKNMLSDKVVLINEKSKYHIVRYGGTIINNSKKLVLYVYPSISDESIQSISFHENLFDDELIEINFTDFDMQDISYFYFGNAERDLNTGDMVIYDKSNLPKHIFKFSIEENKEKRVRN